MENVDVMDLDRERERKFSKTASSRKYFDELRFQQNENKHQQPNE